MLSLAIIIAGTVLMVRIADMSDCRPALWGPLTFIITLLCAMFIPLPVINAFIGVVLSYAIMVLVSIVK